MPYINRERRPWLDEGRLTGTPTRAPVSEGELNYVFALESDRYLRSVDHVGYETFTNVTSALRSLAAEIERRFLGPYENEKIRENGDVFTFQHQNLGL